MARYFAPMTRVLREGNGTVDSARMTAPYTGAIMGFINKYRAPIVWLVVIAMVASIGAGFFVTIF